MNKNLKYVVKLIVTFSIVAIFLYFAFRKISFSEVLNYAKNANILYILLASIIGTSTYFIRAYRWKIIVDQTGQKIPFSVLFKNMMISSSLNNLIPRGGDILMPPLLRKRSGYSISGIIGTMVVERIMDLLVFLTITVIFLFLYQDKIGTLYGSVSLNWIINIAIAGGVGLIILLYIMAFTKYPVKLIRIFFFFTSEKFQAGLKNKIQLLQNGMAVVKNKKILALGFLLTFSFSIVGTCASYLSATAFNLPQLYHISIFDLMFMGVLNGVVLYFLPVPGGTGVTHASSRYILTTLWAVNDNLAIAYTTVGHAIWYIIMMAVGGYCILKERHHILKK